MTPVDPQLAGERLLLENVFGPTAVVGLGAPRLMRAVGAAALEIGIVGAKSELTAMLAALGGPAAAPAVPFLAGGKVPKRVPPLASLVVFANPIGTDIVSAIERLLAALVDGGFLYLDLTLTGAESKRLTRVLESTARDVVHLPTTDEGRFRAHGRSDAPGRELPDAEAPEPARAAILFYAKGADGDVEAAVFDLLFRQAVPPELLLVLDDAVAGEAAVPDDLWGMAALAVTQPAILRTGGVGRSAAFTLGLEHCETPLVSMLGPETRLVPGAIRALSHVLLQSRTYDAVVGEAIVLAPGRPPRLRSAEATDPAARAAEIFVGGPCPGTLFRRRRALELGLAPGVDGQETWDLLLRMALVGKIGSLELPVAIATDGLATAALAETARRFAAAYTVERLVQSLGRFPPKGRKRRAHEIRARALAAAGRIGDAAAEYARAAGADGAEVGDYLAAASAYRRSGDARAARSILEQGLVRFPGDPALANARACVAFQLGDADGAAASLAAARARGALSTAGALNRLRLELGSAAEAAWSEFLRDLPEGAFEGYEYLIGRRQDDCGG